MHAASVPIESFPCPVRRCPRGPQRPLETERDLKDHTRIEHLDRSAVDRTLDVVMPIVEDMCSVVCDDCLRAVQRRMEASRAQGAETERVPLVNKSYRQRRVTRKAMPAKVLDRMASSL
jgi:hypothetical protein